MHAVGQPQHKLLNISSTSLQAERENEKKKTKTNPKMCLLRRQYQSRFSQRPISLLFRGSTMQCTVEKVCHHLAFQGPQGNSMISCQHLLIQEPFAVSEQECLYHNAASAGIPTGNLAKSPKLTMTLDSRSSSPPEITAEIASLRIPDTAAGKENNCPAISNCCSLPLQ